MQKIVESVQGAFMEELEAARPYVSAPWDVRLDTVENVEDGVWAAVQA
jgi:hypothetical protein